MMCVTRERKYVITSCECVIGARLDPIDGNSRVICQSHCIGLNYLHFTGQDSHVGTHLMEQNLLLVSVVHFQPLIPVPAQVEFLDEYSLGGSGTLCVHILSLISSGSRTRWQTQKAMEAHSHIYTFYNELNLLIQLAKRII